MLRGLAVDSRTQSIGDYIRRARQERELSAKARTAEGSTAHLKLAHYYEGLVARADTVRDESGAASEEYAGLAARSEIQVCFPFGPTRTTRRLGGRSSYC